MESIEELNQQIGDDVYAALTEYQNSFARNKQTYLGMSSLGGCREYIRATIAGDAHGEPNGPLKWAAFVGTAVGDAVEKGLEQTRGAKTQHRTTVTLPSGIEVSGSTDAVLYEKRLLDFKTVNGFDDIIKDGPSVKYRVQVSGYLWGFIQAGQLPKDSTAHLVYLDRSGKNPHPYVWSCTAEEAWGWLEHADQRLADVTQALQTGEEAGALRDEPESWCWYTGCPFYSNCWAGYQPTEQITAERHIAAMRKYDEARALAQSAKRMQDEAKRELGGFEPAEPVTGYTDDYLLQWTLFESRQGVVMRRIDLRKKGKK